MNGDDSQLLEKVRENFDNELNSQDIDFINETIDEIQEFFDDEEQLYFKHLFSKRGDFEKESYNMNKWLEYFLSFILNAYEKLNDSTNLIVEKKETKTRRIEKVINSTLGYFTKDDIRSQCPDIPEPTINRVFNNLRKDGKIEVVAKGRSAKWKKK